MSIKHVQKHFHLFLLITDDFFVKILQVKDILNAFYDPFKYCFIIDSAEYNEVISESKQEIIIPSEQVVSSL